LYFGLGLAGIRIWQFLPGHELLSEIAQVIVAQIGRH
jgi:hypothetical protein